MAKNPSPTDLDFNQIFQRSFDEANDTIRVDASLTVPTGGFEVIISQDSDSIRVGDGTNLVTATQDSGKTGLDVNVIGGTIQATFPPNLEVQEIETGTVQTSYGEANSVSANVLSTLTTYVAGGPTRIKFCEVSGTNIATYTVLVNGTTINKKQTFYGSLDNDFQFSKGYPIILGDTVTLQVIQQQSSLGDFSGFILMLKDY